MYTLIYYDIDRIFLLAFEANFAKLYHTLFFTIFFVQKLTVCNISLQVFQLLYCLLGKFIVFLLYLYF